LCTNFEEKQLWSSPIMTSEKRLAFEGDPNF